jgi:hypothetical protein
MRRFHQLCYVELNVAMPPNGGYNPPTHVLQLAAAIQRQMLHEECLLRLLWEEVYENIVS